MPVNGITLPVQRRRFAVAFNCGVDSSPEVARAAAAALQQSSPLTDSLVSANQIKRSERCPRWRSLAQSDLPSSASYRSSAARSLSLGHSSRFGHNLTTTPRPQLQ